MNETSVASPTIKIVEEHPPIIPAAVKDALDKAKAVQAEIAAKELELREFHGKLTQVVGSMIVPKDESVKARGKIVGMHPRYAFGHRIAPAYRIESEPHGAIPGIVPCDELEAGYNVEG